MKTCKFCGKALNDDARFCPQCGNRVDIDVQGESAACGANANPQPNPGGGYYNNGNNYYGAPNRQYDGGYNSPNNNPAGNVKRPSALQTVAKVFMIISIASSAALAVVYFFVCIALGAVYDEIAIYFVAAIVCVIVCALALAWTIPMFVIYNRKIKAGEHISTAFKVCTLLFFNTVAGILLLCDH